MEETALEEDFNKLCLSSRPDEDCQITEDGLIVENGGILVFRESLWPKLKALTHIHVSKSNIYEFPDSLGDIVGLRCLQASHNVIATLPSSIGQLKSLVKLILSYNKLADLPDTFADLHGLEYLDVSHNELKAPPNCFQNGCLKLVHFDISYNLIEDWSFGPLCVYGLKYFNCSHNCLQSNPFWLWGNLCQSLEELDLSFNSFSNPSSMVKSYTLWRTGVTVTLKNLHLSNCGLNCNHVNLLHQLKALKRLRIGNMSRREELRYSLRGRRKSLSPKRNLLWHLSFKPFQSCCVLTEIYLPGVGLSSLPEDISCLEALEILDCHENTIQWLPGTFSRLSKLRIAIFSNNKLILLPEDFGSLLSLEELRLDCNDLGELPASFSNLRNLRWLDLYSNNFETVPLCIEEQLTYLSGLDLEYNRFESASSLNKKVYKILMKAMRERPQEGMENEVERIEGQRPVEDVDSYESSYSESCSDSGSTISEEDSENVCEPVVEQDENNCEEEVWDLDDGEDDYFDPTCMPDIKPSLLPKRALIINEIVLRPDSFCPSDIHPSPSIRAGKDPFAPEEGQFDDA